MKIHLVRYWDQLCTSYWFIPGLMALGAFVCAAALVYYDWHALEGSLPVFGLLDALVADASGARTVLATIAGSAITVAGVIFSITIVVLNMASAQFGPRLLRNFMEHSGSQVVLGIYVATFIYCLMVLSTVRSEDDMNFVPQHAVAGGLLLGMVSFAALIYFIHHVSIFIQVPNIIDDVATKLAQMLDKQFSERRPGGTHSRSQETYPEEDQENDLPVPEFSAGTWRGLSSRRSGYVQAVDYERLLEIAVTRGLVLRLTCRPGHFMIARRALLHATPIEKVDEAAVAEMTGAIILGPERTSTQDPEYGVRQLVEIALRALSPGTNDPFTAINAIDRLSAILAFVGTRVLGARVMCDKDNHVRLITKPSTYSGIVDAAFNQIRQHARGNVAVTLRLLSSITSICEMELPPSFRKALRAQVDAIYELNQECLPAGRDRETLETYYRGALEMLEREPDTGVCTPGNA